MSAALRSHVFCIQTDNRDMLEDLRSSLHQSIFRMVASGDAPAGVRFSNTLSAIALTETAQLQLNTNYGSSSLRCEITPRAETIKKIDAEPTKAMEYRYLFDSDSASLLQLVEHAVLGNTLVAAMSTGTTRLQEPLRLVA